MIATLPKIKTDPLLNNKVVVMEDDLELQQKISDVMKIEFNWDVIIANSLDEVIHIAEKNEAAYYIFDVHMGNDRDHEGIDALEVVKDINNKSFVSIFTAHLPFQTQAVKAGADFSLQKSTSFEKDICRIAKQMILHKIKYFEQDIDIEELKKIYEQLYKLSENLSLRDATVNNDNLNAYEELKSNPEWFQKYQDKYVAFVDGQFVGSDTNREALLDWLIEAEEYQDKKIFFTKVEAEDRIIDEPTSSWLDIVYEGDKA